MKLVKTTFAISASACLLLAGCDASGPKPKVSASQESSSSTPQPASTSDVPSVAQTKDESPLPSPTQGEAGNGVVLVEAGKALAVVVIPTVENKEIREAVDTFVQRVKRSTGSELPVVTEEAAASLTGDAVKLRLMVQGVNGNEVTDALAPESYRIEKKDGDVLIHAAAVGPGIKANPGLTSRPLMWALNSLLEEGLGARWLWPGELGTYLPQRDKFAVTARNEAVQPQLEYRSARLLLTKRAPLGSIEPAIDERLEREALQWGVDQRMGSRSEFVFGHAFSRWWEKYSKDHPDYFAELPPELKQPYPKPGAVKLRLSNPAVIEQIAQEYTDAGAPKYWNVCPNDGSGFDISKETLAWDLPQGQNISDIVQSRAKLTTRYVRFWNLLYERLKQINPDVELLTYAYSAYRDAPLPGHPLTAKAIIQVVDAADAYENWKGWRAGGHRLFLRPNWWHQGADAPYLAYELNNRFFRFAAENGMLGMDMDSVLGYWATQGVNYYTMARLLTDPKLTDEEMIREYTEAFGKGAPKINEYISYWRELSKKYNYSINAAGGTEPANSEYQKLVKQGRIPRSVLNGSKYVLPYLYSDEVLQPALTMLDEAATLIGDESSEEARRVKFLREGLDSLKATREQVKLGQKLKLDPNPERLKEFVEGRKQLEKQREAWTRDHVLWAGSTKLYEERYHILLRESAFGRNEINLDGF